ncbi:signal transducer CD24 [Sceloporus undulatus]|uniref:signal transducer CD24 n=1 Tax=Sceloporus undulatus TaxID=8520 RepID=UPI001C4A9160|nr:signal transducer CD24 [Sceloporus undulatus]
MGRALDGRLGMGLLLLLLLALLLPAQVVKMEQLYPPPNSTSSVTSVPLSTLNITTPAGHGNSLQSATGLFILAIFLLYVC